MLKLLFDTRNILYAMQYNKSRNGVYFAALNILKEFAKREDIKLTLYAPGEYTQGLNVLFSTEEVLKNCEVAPLFIPIKRTGLVNFLLRVIYKILRSLRIKFIPLEDYKFDYNALKVYNAFFSPYDAVPQAIKQCTHITKYTLIHDCIPLILPEYCEESNGAFSQMLAGMNEHDFYFANSEFTKQDFLKYVTKLKPQQITTTLLAASDNFYPYTDSAQLITIKNKYSIPDHKKYLFSLCSLESRKNLIMAVRAYCEFIKKNKINDLVYVLGGANISNFIEELQQKIPNFTEHASKIIAAGFIDSEDLAPLYSAAEFFVYTSQYEGFGLPVLEAMQCGKAVITSNNSSLPEVVGDAAIMIDYDNLVQHVTAFEKLYFDSELRKNYEVKALEQAKKFSWKKCADTMLAVMQKNSNSGN